MTNRCTRHALETVRSAYATFKSKFAVVRDLRSVFCGVVLGLRFVARLLPWRCVAAEAGVHGSAVVPPRWPAAPIPPLCRCAIHPGLSGRHVAGARCLNAVGTLPPSVCRNARRYRYPFIDFISPAPRICCCRHRARCIRLLDPDPADRPSATNCAAVLPAPVQLTAFLRTGLRLTMADPLLTRVQ